jgi:hypothetical protein
MVIVKADYLLAETPFLLHARYTLNAKGEMQVEQWLEVDTTQPRDTTAARPAPKYPPLFGMKWGLPAGLDSILYFGSPPDDKDADSCHHNYVGPYRQTLEDSAARTDIRWWKLTDKQGHGWLISADSTLLTMRIYQRRMNINHPITPSPTGTVTDNYHYFFKVTPQ